MQHFLACKKWEEHSKKQQAVISTAAGNASPATLLRSLVAKIPKLDCCAAHSPLWLAFSAASIEFECHFDKSSVDTAVMHHKTLCAHTNKHAYVAISHYCSCQGCTAIWRGVQQPNNSGMQ